MLETWQCFVDDGDGNTVGGEVSEQAKVPGETFVFPFIQNRIETSRKVREFHKYVR